jgi:predicted nucleotidyltransferase component of viral defense system
MKKVAEETKLRIMDLISEQGLGIADFALEKDFIVFDVLRALSTLKHPNFDLVFCGGTCLSKAYGLLDRVSEDVDIKVVNKPKVVLNGRAPSSV